MPLTRQQAARQGVLAAQREHQRLGTSLERRVEVFDIIADERIWLRSGRLGNLFGAYERYEDVAGILIHALHPLSVQRYTAAHEYGHHVLGHQASLDDKTLIFDQVDDVAEVAAQAFAGEFTMPLQLVNFTLAQMGRRGTGLDLSAQDAYQFAVELGVSYAAAVTHLLTLRRISPATARRLRRETPQEIKKRIGGIPPNNPWSDVWSLDETNVDRPVSLGLRDELDVALSETPSSGYRWRVVEPAGGIMELVNDEFHDAADSGEVVGASGVRRLRFRVASAGVGRIVLANQRPWEASARSAATFEATIEARSPFAGVSESELSVVQAEALLSGASAA